MNAAKQLSKYELAMIYKRKCELLGIREIEFSGVSRDVIELAGVDDKSNADRLIIPSFITGTDQRKIPLKYCNFSEIQVLNDCKFDASWLCAMMKSKTLRIEFSRPDLVTDMTAMFRECSNLTELDISNLSITNVKSMDSTFYGCESLKKIVLRGMESKKLNTMKGLFGSCTSLEEAELSDLDISKVTNMDKMFYGCRNLKCLRINNVKTDKLETIQSMFDGCTSLEVVDLRGLSMEHITNAKGLFRGCKNLMCIKLPDIEFGFDIDGRDLEIPLECEVLLGNKDRDWGK